MNIKKIINENKSKDESKTGERASMNYKNSGEIISEARKQKGYTQKEVASRINVSDKAVSKWERGVGCPDVRILSELAKVLEIDTKVLLSGIATCNEVDNGNLKRSKFYVCPICGNTITSTSTMEISCCGKQLRELESSKEDENHIIIEEIIDNEYYIRIDNHPMMKNHYISFICYVTSDKFHLVKLYPEQNCEVRFRKEGHGFLYVYCNVDGLYRKII